jgi:hypothetical protein
MSLTPKQEAFAQAIADGKTQSDAYRSAFDVSPTTKPETIHKRASELMSDGEVTGRVAELKKTLSAKALWTREMSVKALVESYRVAKDRKNSNGMTGAVKELNAMHGYNEPQQIDLNIRQLPASVDDFV